MQRGNPGVFWAFAVVAGAALAVPALGAEREIVGRWDITLGDGHTPCWLGVEQKDGQFAARFLHIYASVFDLKEFKFENSTVEFKTGGTTWIGKVEGDAITGTTTNQKGDKGQWTAKRFVPKINPVGAWAIDGQEKTTLRLRRQNDQIRGRLIEAGGQGTQISDATLEGTKLQFTAGDKKCTATIKGDVMDGTLGDAKFTAKRNRQWDEPIELFNGKDLEGWKPLGDPSRSKWKVIDGVMHCDGHGSANIVTEKAFEDFKLHVEFKVPEGGNSGVYLRGRYEIQVADSAGKKAGEHECGALYSRIAPSENVCKPAGEWQTFDITLIDHYLTVVQNGKTIINNQEIEGITGGAIDSNEGEPGPIYLQGDHTAIDYRKITLTPAKPPTAGGRRARAAS